MSTEHIQKAVEAVPGLYRGPGGAVAVLKDGKVVAKSVWGYADIDRRIPMTDETLMPICSITKHWVCLLLMEITRHEPFIKAAGGDVWKRLSQKLAEVFPPGLVEQSGLKLEHLCNMTSGLRDYWALTTLWGSKPDDVFSLENDAPKMFQRYKSFHFEPNTQYSYSNMNFYTLARLIESVCGEDLAPLLSRFVFKPAGMETAALVPDTAKQPGDCIGYEFNEEKGFMPAINRMQWAGDAGAIVSLNDMIAFEQFADVSLGDVDSAYSAIAREQYFSDGTPTIYGFGLGRSTVEGVKTLNHGGALRGYRLHRMQAVKERISVVVMFNHEADSGAAAKYILKKALGQESPPDREPPVEPDDQWFGEYLDDTTKLAIPVKKSTPGKISIKYGGTEPLTVMNYWKAQSKMETATLLVDPTTRLANRIRLERRGDHNTLIARKLETTARPQKSGDFVGRYECEEIGSTFTCTGSGDLLYGFFDGYLGKGPVHLMKQFGKDIWLLSCPRGLDAPAPGDWTLVFARDSTGSVSGVTIGCWLARNLEFVKKP